MKRPPNKKIIEALDANFSILVNTAQYLGCSRSQLRIWLDNDPELLEGWKQGKEKLKDMVEFQLLKNIKDGKEASLIWYAKTQMKDRGYIEKTDMNLTIDAIKIKYIVPTEDNKLLDNPDIKIIDNI